LRRTAPPTPTAACPGDCDESGEVGVAELVAIVRMALANDEARSCPAADVRGDGTIQLDDIAQAVFRSLHGCAATPAGGAAPAALRR
jgi:hypothetical protein